MACIAGNGWRPRILIALSPVYIWLIAITALPHKEERFMYVVYPLVGPQLWHITLTASTATCECIQWVCVPFHACKAVRNNRLCDITIVTSPSRRLPAELQLKLLLYVVPLSMTMHQSCCNDWVMYATVSTTFTPITVHCRSSCKQQQ